MGDHVENNRCPFCGDFEVLIENDLAHAKEDAYPVSPGHCLIITKRHVSSYFDCTDDEKQALWALVDEAREWLEVTYKPNSYNIGINAGKEAGQTVPHIHIHLIPRYDGDMEDPRGGVRGVIPSKQKY